MANPASAFPSAPPRFFDQGNGAKLLQPQNQVPFVADQAAYDATSFNALRNALVTAGIMLPS